MRSHGLDLVAHLEEQRARRRSVTPSWRMSGCSAAAAKSSGASVGPPAAPGRAGFAVGPQRRQRRRRALALLVDELHPAQKRPGEPAQPGVPLGGLLEAGLPVAPRPVRQVGLVPAQPAPRAQLTAIEPATRRRRRRGRAAPSRGSGERSGRRPGRCALSMSSRRASTSLRLRSKSLRTCRGLVEPCRATLGGGSTPGRGAGAGPPSRAPGRPRRAISIQPRRPGRAARHDDRRSW